MVTFDFWPCNGYFLNFGGRAKGQFRSKRPNSLCFGVPRTSITTIFGGILKIHFFSFWGEFWAPLTRDARDLHLLLLLSKECSCLVHLPSTAQPCPATSGSWEGSDCLMETKQPTKRGCRLYLSVANDKYKISTRMVAQEGRGQTTKSNTIEDT